MGNVTPLPLQFPQASTKPTHGSTSSHTPSASASSVQVPPQTPMTSNWLPLQSQSPTGNRSIHSCIQHPDHRKHHMRHLHRKTRRPLSQPGRSCKRLGPCNPAVPRRHRRHCRLHLQSNRHHRLREHRADYHYNRSPQQECHCNHIRKWPRDRYTHCTHQTLQYRGRHHRKCRQHQHLHLNRHRLHIHPKTDMLHSLDLHSCMQKRLSIHQHHRTPHRHQNPNSLRFQNNMTSSIVKDLLLFGPSSVTLMTTSSTPVKGDKLHTPVVLLIGKSNSSINAPSAALTTEIFATQLPPDLLPSADNCRLDALLTDTGALSQTHDALTPEIIKFPSPGKLVHA